MTVLGLVPARGGSKGIPGKNLRTLGGKPLIAWACGAALAARRLDAVVCSTDDAAIAAAANAAGVPTPFPRPAELARDETPVIEVIAHALRWAAERGHRHTHVALVQPTTPFTDPDDIDRAVALAIERDADTVVSGYRCGQQHPSTMFRLGDGAAVEWLADDGRRMARRQDLTTWYFRSGAVYVFRSAMILERGTLYGERIHGIEVAGWRATSIDEEEDLVVAEALLRHRRGEGT